MWMYLGEEVKSIDDMPEGTVGFVYEVVSKSDNLRYIGKKSIYANRTLPPLKGQKRKRKVTKESDWAKYYGSNAKVKEMRSEGLEFNRVILEYATSKYHLTYLENVHLYSNRVLEDKCFLNDNISGKFYARAGIEERDFYAECF